MSFFTKQPAEDYDIALDFNGKLPAGASLSSGTVSAIRLDTGADQTAVVLGSTVATISGTQASIHIQAGTDGIQYKITILFTLSTGRHLEEDLIMSVVAK